MSRFVMYHPDNDPDGHEYDTDEISMESLVGQGWVDDPAKFGHSPTGQASKAFLDAQAQRYQGHMNVVGDVAPGPNAAQLAAEVAELVAKNEQRERDFEAMRTKLSAAEERAQKAEQARDEKADAVRGSTRAPRKRTPKPAAAKNTPEKDPKAN